MNKQSRPKLFAVCFVKNEEDIIADCLRHAARFCDRIYVVDNASTDRTWEIVKDLDLAPVVPVGSKDFIYREYLRIWFMGLKERELGRNNWWYILDADMLLDGDPLGAIAQAEKEGADAIAVNVINFHITKEEIIAAAQSGRRESWRDRRYYGLYESGEIDLFKNTGYLDYGLCARVPLGLTKECSLRLPSRHYPHRFGEQLKKRILTRSENPDFEPQLKRGTEWEHYLIDPATSPGIKCLNAASKEIDFTGGFSYVVPPIGRYGRSRIFATVVRALYPLGLLPLFYAFYNRYAFWRQKIEPREKDIFLSTFRDRPRGASGPRSTSKLVV
ncbi:MAG: glycosyltransferase family 2 protein [Candidatus Erginobacter occultus]|nr:glycosyltransferase family 2 protein [Candidatus Erginobacter occultus]